ncbi:hypothetical protein DH2020_022801 [Rehmannia glutinosa]|uniref:Ionotropic glutamate receptor C-terminal domain-containing protein n=1 Tax=Rehmannia glutinosa TaxID=99300 RepID=A0ABR0W469_REHGL
MKFSVMAVAFTLLVLVDCEKPNVVKVGCVFTFDSVIGRGAKIAMEMAVEDINSDPRILNGTELRIIMEDTSCSVFMGSIKDFQVIENEVVAIVGPQSSGIARIISHVANGLQVPVISYAASDPMLSSVQFPYFFRMAPTDSNQMAAIADIIEFYGWKEVIAIFSDDDYGRNGVNALGDKLAKKTSKISYKLPLSPEYDQTEVYGVLNKSKSFGPRVYVVHICPDPRFLEKNRGITFSSSGNRNLKVFDGGEDLLKFISNSNFTGLTGHVQFDADRNLMRVDYEIINVVRETTYKVGYWSNYSGVSVQKLKNITWPCGEVETPRGWVIATAEKPLRIAFPKRVSFSEFVTKLNNSHRVQGYCIDLFNEVLKLIPYDVPFRFEPFGNGQNNPNYDELVRMVADDVFDAAVGDIAIVADRIKIVDFTLPFAATGLVIVAPTVNLTSSGWVFMKPFTPELWCATAASFVIIAVVIWMLEHLVNDDFRGPPRRQLRTMFLEHNFQGKFQEKGKKNFRIALSTLFAFKEIDFGPTYDAVITSIYTASLSSILTVEQLSTCITGLDSLISSGLPIGYQVGSFAYSYMINSLNIHPSRLVSLGSPKEYESALRRGPTNGGVAAIVDEIPYVELFLSKQTDFGIVGQPFTKSGWGFAFQKNSPLAIDMSTAILKLSESGELQKIHENGFVRRRAVRQHNRYKRTHTDPSSPGFSISSINVPFSQSVHNFLEFIDEKEEAIKRIFAQHENPPARVN